MTVPWYVAVQIATQGEFLNEAVRVDLAPKLVESSWFADGGNVKVLARVLLKGQSGPIDGVTYGEGLMPPLETSHTDEQIAAVLTYVGQRWHQWKNPVDPALVAQVQESCSAAVLDGTDIVYVLRVPTRKIMSISLGVGSRLPAYCTSMGRILLAALPPDELMNCLKASDLQARTKYTLTDASDVAAKVAQVRRQGWALVNQELEEGLVSAAAPVKNRAGKVVAALNASWLANRTSATAMKEQLLPKLRTAADDVSALLSRTIRT